MSMAARIKGGTIRIVGWAQPAIATKGRWDNCAKGGTVRRPQVGSISPNARSTAWPCFREGAASRESTARQSRARPSQIEATLARLPDRATLSKIANAMLAKGRKRATLPFAFLPIGFFLVGFCLCISGCAPKTDPAFSLTGNLSNSAAGPVWPPPPDPPRIRYVGELVGEASLGRKTTIGESLQAVVTGPPLPLAFATPLGVATAGDLVFVADPGQASGPCVHVLNLASRTHTLLQKIGNTALAWPIDLATFSTKLVIADAKNAAVYLIDTKSSITQGAAPGAAIGQGLFKRPASVAWSRDGSAFFVLDTVTAVIHEFSADGRHLRSFGSRGGGEGQFNFPAGMCVTFRTPTVRDGRAESGIANADAARPLPHGRGSESSGGQNARPTLAVADSMNFRVQVLSDDGKPIATFGGKGDAAGKFALPRDVASDSAGNLYVLDNQFENVQVFDSSGQLLMALGGEGRGPGQFNLPSAITIDECDRIWIADTYNRRVQVFQCIGEK